MAGKAQLIVTTVTGGETAHEYDIPDDANEALQFVKQISQSWAMAFAGRISMVPMQNPSVFYRMEHVVSLELRLVGREELESEIQRTIGFPIPGSSDEPT